MKTKRGTSLLLAIALVISTLASAGPAPAKAAQAAELITVYLAAQGKNATGTSVQIGKTAMQVEEGTTADVVVKEVLDNSDYKDNYEILDTGYGPYLESINGMGTESAGENWYYWSFYVNGSYSLVGMGSYELQDNDKISLIYSYEDYSMEAKDFVDDESLNPATEQAIALKEAAQKQQKVLAEAIYQAQFGSENVVPGLENTNGLYTVFSLIQAGYENADFYQDVYKKLVQQLYELKETGKTKDETTGEDITEASILETGNAEAFYAKIVLAVSAMGMDAANVGGYNLIEKMASRSVYEASGASYTRAATMLLALDSASYALPEGEEYVTRTELVNSLVNEVEPQIGSSISWGVDMAAMTIQPLAPYTKEGNLAEQEEASFNREGVAKAANKALRFLESMQSAEGFYGDSWSANNVWSLSQVMTVMGQFGISPVSETDGSDFIKNGKSVLDAASEFVNVEEGTVDENLMSYQPEQLLRGLSACLAVMNGEKALYDVNAAKKAPLVTPVEPVPAEPQNTNPAPTATSGNTTSGNNVTSNGGITAPSTPAGVLAIKPKISAVLLSPGKSTKIKYTVKMTENATTAAVVTAKSSNKKVVTAKLVGGKVKITAKKKAVKGASAKVTLLAGDKKAVIKVAIKNSVKSIKAKKSKITIKKGKTTKVTFKIKCENPKKAFTDYILVRTNEKALKVMPKITINKKKIVLRVKGLKKGKTTIQVKIGKKKAKVTAIVM